MKLQPYILNFGRHSEKDALRLLITEIDYVKHVFSYENPEGPLLALRSALRERISALDALPWRPPCMCGSRAAVATSRTDSPISINAYCNACDPYMREKRNTTLLQVGNYWDAINLSEVAKASKKTTRAVVRRYAALKGLRPNNARFSAADLANGYTILNEADCQRPTLTNA